MNILITGAATPLGKHLAAGLRVGHQLRLTDRTPIDTDLEFVPSELGHDESTDRLVEGVETIIHQAYLPREGDGASDWLDASTRRTYNLLLAASEAGVKQVIYLSTLDLFLPYDEDLTVAENWRPRPTCQPDRLGPHLGEFIAKEFAHSHALKVLILRLGHIVTAAEAKEQKFDPMWVDVRDVVGAAESALGQSLREFGVAHLQCQSERARFVSHSRRHSLDYAPQHNFEEHA